MNTITRDYLRFRKLGGGIVGESALWALRDARTLAEWRELESEGLVRLRAEPEQENYFDVYGESDDERERQAIIDAIDRDGCWYVVAEYLEDGEWQHADSIGMCIYRDPTCPFENPYVTDLMRGAMRALPAEIMP